MATVPLPSPSDLTPARPAHRPSLRAATLALTWLLCAAPLSADPRVWTSSDGKTVTAELLDATETTVTIKAENGREFTLAHERLSQADRDVVTAFLAQKKAATDQISWPAAKADEVIKAPYFKKLHALDPKKHAATYAGRILLIEGTVTDIREDRMTSTQGMIIVLESEDRVPIEFRFSKANYDKDLTLLLGTSYHRYRGPYDIDEFRVGVKDKSLIVERRFVTSRDSDYNSTTGNYRYRNKWSDWEIVAKPLSRGETVKLRGEFVSVFNSIVSFTDARLIESESFSSGSGFLR
jgi:hypothetical protein